jgi:hypothetical protein
MWGGYTPPPPPQCICRPAAAAQEDERSLCPLEEPTFLEFLDTTPGDDQAADEDDESASNVPSSRLK